MAIVGKQVPAREGSHALGFAVMAGLDLAMTQDNEAGAESQRLCDRQAKCRISLRDMSDYVLSIMFSFPTFRRGQHHAGILIAGK